MVDVITITVSEFRSAMPAFSDATKYSNTLVSTFIDQAGNYISTKNCGVLRDNSRVYALELMTAHLLTLNDMILSGNIGASSKITSTSIDKISVSTQAPNTRNEWAYWLSLTPYGTALLALLQSKAPFGIYSGGTNYRGSLR